MNKPGLVLRRQVGQSITITTENNQKVEVEFLEVKGGWAQVAIKAPQSIKINRSEFEK